MQYLGLYVWCPAYMEYYTPTSDGWGRMSSSGAAQGGGSQGGAHTNSAFYSVCFSLVFPA